MNRDNRRHLRQPRRRRAPTNTVSMTSRRKFAGSAIAIVALIATLAGLCPPNAGAGGNDRINLYPKLVVGQVLTYQIGYHADKSATTKSTVATSRPQSPSGTETNVRVLLRLEVLGVEKQGARATVRARTSLQVLNSAIQMTVPRDLPTPPDQVQRQDPNGVSIEFTINPDGRIDQVKGLDLLCPEQQQAW